MTTPSLLLISGSVRTGSVNEAVVRTIADRFADRALVTVFDGLLALPHFDPDLDVSDDALPAAVVGWRDLVDASDAVLICTPEYAGAMPGVLKTALEWTIGAGSLNDKHVGWINPSTSPMGARDTYASLRLVLRFAGAAFVEDACVDAPVPRAEIVDGRVVSASALERIDAAVDALLAAAG
jgi:NAD(P)H-dependent FMN reductase